jgi:hypothetical protein
MRNFHDPQRRLIHSQFCNGFVGEPPLSQHDESIAPYRTTWKDLLTRQCQSSPFTISAAACAAPSCVRREGNTMYYR